ncbi:sorbosone dehydrogenase family protein [soil metagenome]
MPLPRPLSAFATTLALFAVGCTSNTGGAPPPSGNGEVAAAPPAAPPPSAASAPACDADNGGLTLPSGFCALVVADVEGTARHLAVTPDGRIYVALADGRDSSGGIVALRDTTGDGKADQRVRFGDQGGTALRVEGEWLYFAPNDRVVRYRLGEGLRPAGEPETVVSGLPEEHSHTSKALAFGSGGAMFVNVGAPTNACQPQDQDREAGVKGLDPCPQLETRAGIWRFAADRAGQTQADGERFATGVRNAIALAVRPQDGQLYAVQHGRDQLGQWPGYTEQNNADRPSEEMLRLTRGSDAGWPYCYHDPASNRKVVAPEYGGNGERIGRCADKVMPIVAFPAHWAPQDLLFYGATHFPQRYRGGAFVAWHGSWNRAPLPQEGYRVSFVPFAPDGTPGAPETFADGFTGPNPQPRTAPHRPMGLAVGADGSLYIADSSGGRIWRVMYRGA